MPAEEFISEMLKRLPELQPICEEHVADNGTLLPHVFLGEVTSHVVSEANHLKSAALMARLFDYFEDGLSGGDDEVAELIGVSFAENLIGEATALDVMKPLMGPLLKAEVERFCE